jgi:hypothetical protein
VKVYWAYRAGGRSALQTTLAVSGVAADQPSLLVGTSSFYIFSFFSFYYCADPTRLVSADEPRGWLSFFFIFFIFFKLVLKKFFPEGG